LPLGILAWLYLVVLWLTWTPVGAGPSEVLWRPPGSWTPFLGNLLLLAPLGFVLAVHRAPRIRSRDGLEFPGLVSQVALTAAVLSVAVELGQFRVPGRNVSPWDVALNTSGAALAAWFGARLVRSGLDARHLVGAAMGVVFTGVLLFLIATGFTASRMVVLSDWNGDYPIFAGDEPSGDRAYDGSVSGARICADLPEGELCAEPGATQERTSALSRAAQDTQAVRLSAVVTARGPQSGDARIVTFSPDTRHRNATIYQDGRDLVLRLRTPLGGPNGTGLEFVLPEAVPDGVPTRVHGSFQVGRIEMAAGEGAVRAEFPIGPFSSWWLVRPLPERRVEPGPLRRAGLVAAAAYSIPLGLGLVLIFGWGPPLLLLMGGALAPPVLLVLLTSVLGIPVSAWEAALAAGLGSLGVVLGTLRRPGRGARKLAAAQTYALAFLVALGAGIAPLDARAQQTSSASPLLTPDHWAHGALARLHGAGLLSEGFDPGIRSVTRLEAFRRLEEAIREAEGRAPAWVEAGTAYRDRLAEEFPGAYRRVSGDRPGPGTDLAVEAGLEARRNALLATHYSVEHGDFRTIELDDRTGLVAGLDGSLYLSPFGASVAGQGAVQLRGTGLRATELYGVVQVRKVGAWAGRRHISFGAADGGSMVMSAEVPFDGGGFFLSDGVRMPGFLRYLGNLQVESFVARLDRTGEVESPWFFGLRTSLAPHPRLRLGVNRGALFGGDGESVPPVSFRRILRMLSGIDTADEGRSNFEDHVGGVDLWFAPPLGPHLPLALYGEWAVEDLEAQKDEMPGFALGARLSSVPGAPWLTVGFEWTSLAAAPDRLRWYDHRVFGTWTDQGRLLGHGLGGEGRELRAYGAADLVDARLRLEGRALTRRRYQDNLYAPVREGSSRGLDAAARWRLTRSLEVTARGAREWGPGWSESDGFLGVRVTF
jgi:glycopeptide antibiotics resistance protein